MNLLRNTLVAGIGAASLATAAQAQYWWIPRGWHVIGTKTVNGRHDTDDVYTPRFIFATCQSASIMERARTPEFANICAPTAARARSTFADAHAISAAFE